MFVITKFNCSWLHKLFCINGLFHVISCDTVILNRNEQINNSDITLLYWLHKQLAFAKMFFKFNHTSAITSA
jgi:hypothetical protein